MLASSYFPLENLQLGDVVQVGAFKMTVTSVQALGTTGHYKGTGQIPIDFLFGMKENVKFEDLQIDREYMVWDGTAIGITDGLENWLVDQYQQFQDEIYIAGTVDSAYVSDSLVHLVIDGVDTTFEFPCPTCYITFHDDAGHEITVYPDGTVKRGSYLDVSDEALDVDAGETATFAENASETGGFDAKTYQQWHADYEIITTSDQQYYFVPNKSVHSGQSDVVDLLVPDAAYEHISLSIAGQTITPNESTTLDAEGFRHYTFTLPASLSQGTHEVYAKGDSLKIGKLNVVVYASMTKHVVLVPVITRPIFWTTD